MLKAELKRSASPNTSSRSQRKTQPLTLQSGVEEGLRPSFSFKGGGREKIN